MEKPVSLVSNDFVPVSNVSKYDVAKKAANIEERCGNMRPLGIVAH